jgi:uncharacterized membrane protein YvbJ
MMRGMTSAPEPAPAPMFSEPPPKKRSALKIILIIVAAGIVGIVVLILALVLFVNGSTKDAQKVSDQLVTAVQTGDTAQAYALTGPSFRAATKQADLDELVKRLSTLVTKEKVSPSGKSINASTDSGKIAVFTYVMKGTSGKPVYFKTQIRDEDGDWRVMNFRSSETALTTEVE